MIAKGNVHGEGQKLAAYLVAGHPGEKAELVEMRGFAAGNLADAFRDIEIEALGTKAETAFFHCYTRLSPGEKLTDEQWRQLADREERRLGFTGQPRAVAFHINQETGEKHMHIAWSRIGRTGDGQLFAIDPGLYKDKLKAFCREYELKFGLRQVSSERSTDQKTRYADRNEFEEARRLDTDLKSIRNTIHDCFQHSDNGMAFNSALEAQGYILAKGDRRDCFVVVDQSGGHHALNKRLTGMTLAETRARLADLDAAILPSVDWAKAMQEQHRQALAEARQQQERQQAGKRAGQGSNPALRAERPPKDKPLGKSASEVRAAWVASRDGDHFAEKLAENGLRLAFVTPEEARASQRTHEFARVIGRQSRALREGFAVVDRRGNVTRLNWRTTGDHARDIEKRLAGIERDSLPSVADARAEMREKNQAEFRERRETERAARASVWQQHRATTTVDQKQRAAARENRIAGSSAASATRDSAAGMDAVFNRSLGGAGRFLGAAAKTAHSIFDSLFGWAMAPPKLTPEQAKNAERAHEEKQEQAAWVASAAEQEARFRELQEQMAKEAGERRRLRRENGRDEDIDRDR